MLNDRHLQLEFWQSSEMTHHQVWLTPNYSSLKNTPWTSFVKSMSRITCRFLFVSYPFSFFSAMIAKCLKLFFRFLFHQFNRFWRIFLPWPRKSVWYTTKRQTLFSFNIVDGFESKLSAEIIRAELLYHSENFIFYKLSNQLIQQSYIERKSWSSHSLFNRLLNE